MPDIASALKAEIARIARKEVRGETSDLKKSSSQHRSHIAALRRKVEELERAVKQASKQAERQKPQHQEGVALRFRAGGFAAHRQRLGLSAADFGQLIGVSGQTVYKWEKGEARPRASQLPAIAAARSMGKREALAKLAEAS